MAWQTPKTDWDSAGNPLPADFNRIEGNEAYLYDKFHQTTGHKHTGAADDGPKIDPLASLTGFPLWVDIVFHAGNNTSGDTWFEMPAALTDLFGKELWRRYDLTLAKQVRLYISKTSGTCDENAKLRAQYSTNGGTTWNYFDGVSQPQVSLWPIGSAPVSSWINIPSAAKTEVLLRIVGVGGNDSADPAFGFIILQIR